MYVHAIFHEGEENNTYELTTLGTSAATHPGQNHSSRGTCVSGGSRHSKW